MSALTSSARRPGRAWLIALPIASLIALAAWALPAAHAAGCENSWTNSKGGSWFTAENWSKKAVPTSTEEVCITAEGTYSVTMTQTSGSVSVKALTVGGTSGTQTLVVGSSCSANAFLATTAGISIGAHGAITITNGDGCGNNVTLEGPISNAGTITSEPATGGTRSLQGNLTNTGTVAINTNTAYNGTSALLTNEGAINLAEAKQLAVSAKGSVTNGTGGKIAATGSANVLMNGGETSFTEGAGTTSGTKPVIVDDGTLTYSGSGASAIAIRGSSSLSGSLSAGQSLSIESTCGEHATVTAATGFTNAGAITLTNGDGCSNNATLTISSGTLTNSGTITSEPAIGGLRQLQGNLTNTGKLVVNANTAYNASGTTLTNSGAINIATGVALSAPAHPTISNEAGGVIAGTGTGALVQTEGTFNQGLGTTTGSQPVILDRVALHYTNKGKSTIALRGSSTLSGTINAGQTLSIQSTCGEHATTTAAGSFVNSGTLVLTNGDGCGNNATLSLSGGTLADKGTVKVENPHGGVRAIEGSLKNEKAVSVAAGETLKLTGSYTQTTKGSLTIAIASASSFGALSATGAATLAGALSVAPAKGFKGSLGQTYGILSASSLTGTFSDVDGAVITKSLPGLYYKPTYSATGVTLVVAQAKLAAAPTEGLPGSSVKLTGSGFPATDTVTLTFTDSKGVKTILPSVVSNASGEFSSEVTVPSGAAVGAGTFSAASALTGVVAAAPFTVT